MFSKNRLLNFVIWLTIICAISFSAGISMILSKVGDFAHMSYNSGNLNYEIIDQKSAGTIDGISEININSSRISTNIIKSDSNEIKAVLSGVVKGASVNRKITFDVGKNKGTNGDVIDIKAYSDTHIFIGIDYVKLDVYIPAAYANKINASAESGSIKIQDFKLKEAVLHASSGSIKADNLNVNILDTQASSGSVSMSGLTAAKLSVKANSGSISINDMAITEDINLATSSGSIKAAFKSFTGKAYIRASSGSCAVDFPQNADLDIKASASSGSVNCGLPIKGSHDQHSMEGIVNGGKNTVDVRTSSGSINIE
jgi:DUF4097 and DUF4098 domain-containing protein YvlB